MARAKQRARRRPTLTCPQGTPKPKNPRRHADEGQHPRKQAVAARFDRSEAEPKGARQHAERQAIGHARRAPQRAKSQTIFNSPHA